MKWITTRILVAGCRFEKNIPPPSWDLLKMAAVCSLLTLLTVYQTTRRPYPNHSIHLQYCETLKNRTQKILKIKTWVHQHHLRVLHCVPLSPQFVTGYVSFLNERINQPIDGLLVPLCWTAVHSNPGECLLFYFHRSVFRFRPFHGCHESGSLVLCYSTSPVSFICRNRSPVLVNNTEGLLASTFKITIPSVRIYNTFRLSSVT